MAVLKTTGGTTWWCQGTPKRDGNALLWPNGTALRITRGALATFDAEGHFRLLAVGYAKLKMNDPAPMKHPSMIFRPEAGEMVVEIAGAIQ